MINITSCSEVEAETDEEGTRKKDFLRETDKTMAALEPIPIRLNWGHIFSLPNETCQHMEVALERPKIYAERVKGVMKMSEIPVQCASCKTTVTFTNDDLLLGSEPHNHSQFVTDFIKE